MPSLARLLRSIDARSTTFSFGLGAGFGGFLPLRSASIIAINVEFRHLFVDQEFHDLKEILVVSGAFQIVEDAAFRDHFIVATKFGQQHSFPERLDPDLAAAL